MVMLPVVDTLPQSGRDSGGEAPFKMSRGDQDSSRGRPDQRGRGGPGPQSGYQSRGGRGGGSRWSKPGRYYITALSVIVYR